MYARKAEESGYNTMYLLGTAIHDSDCNFKRQLYSSLNFRNGGMHTAELRILMTEDKGNVRQRFSRHETSPQP
jgi:hypothetical protein